MEPVPETSRTIPEALAEAQHLLDDGRAFGAHEVLEALWKEAAEPHHRALWRGLAQVMVALTHAQRGNHAGTRSLLQRGALTLAEVGPLPEVDVDAWLRWCDVAGAAADAAQPLPAPPRLFSR